MLAESEERLGRAHYLAWDTFGSLEERAARLWDTAQELGLRDPRPSRAGLPKLNTSGDYPLKDAYRAGDLAGLSELCGLEHLIESEDLLRPFLERRGYRDLLWWS
jgi:hypothetical protein